MVARGVGRQVEAWRGAWTHGHAGRMGAPATALTRVDRTGDDARARDGRPDVRRFVAGIRAFTRQRPVLLLGGALTLGLAVLAARFFMRSWSARPTDVTPAPPRPDVATPPAGGTVRAGTADTADTGGALAPTSPFDARMPDAPDAPALTADVGAPATVTSDAPPLTPAHDEATPVRVTGRDGHVPPVVVSDGPLTSTPWPQTPPTLPGDPTP